MTVSIVWHHNEPVLVFTICVSQGEDGLLISRFVLTLTFEIMQKLDLSTCVTRLFNIFNDIAVDLITNELNNSYVSNSSSLLVKRIVHRVVFLLQSINLRTKFMKYKIL